jgi:sugar lactone lactonase YvrE
MVSHVRSRFEHSAFSGLLQFCSFSLLALCSVAGLSAQNVISTIAGGGSVNGPAVGNNADIPGPTSVAVDSAGNVYVASPNAQQVFKIDPSGNLSVLAGLGWPTESPEKNDPEPAIDGPLNTPTGVAVDTAGNVYIADTVNYIIRKVDINGIMTTVAGDSDACHGGNCGDGGPAKNAQLNSPTAVTTDAAGNLYIADTGDNKVRVVNTTASAITIAGATIQPGNIATVAGNGQTCASPTAKCGDGGLARLAQLNSPQGIAVDHMGNIFIADSGDRRIRGVISNGGIGPYAGTGSACFGGLCGDGGPALQATLGNPWQLYVDSKENLYISDSLDHRIRKVAPGKSPTISTVAGNGQSCSNANIGSTFCGDSGAATSAWLNTPHGVTGDASGNLYIGDTGDQRVRKVNPSQVIATYAGGGLSDGPAMSGILASDHDVAVDSAGNVYVADTANNRIRKVVGGNISTVAGNGVANFYGASMLATGANLNSPYGLSVDAAGNVYVADSSNYVIRVVNTQSSALTVAGVTIPPGFIATVAGTPGHQCAASTNCGDGNPATQAAFAFPTKVIVDDAGNLYIADAGAARVRMVNSTGIISTIAGSAAGAVCTTPTNFSACGDGGPATSATLNQPFSLAMDKSNNIYVADAGDNRIRMFSIGGNITAFAFNGITNFGLDGLAALNNSYIFGQYLAIDSRNNLFLSGSSLYYVIQRIDAATSPLANPVASVAGWPVSPKYYGYCCDGQTAVGHGDLDNFGIAVDNAENLYIADGGNNRLREVSSSPTMGLVPTAKVAPNSLSFPATAIGVQSQPLNIAVTDTGSDDLMISGGSTTGPFALVNPNPCPNNQVAPDTSCTFSVTFTPTGYGTQKGTAVINDNAFGSSSQTINLTGAGPDFTNLAQPNSLTIVRGSNGSSTITLTPSAGFNQSVTLSCTGLPKGVSCGFSPNPVSLNGSTASNSTLTVTVGTSAAPGSYAISARGSSVTTHSAPVSLTVQ